MFCDTECILKYREHKRYLQIHHTTPFYVIQELLKDFWFYFDDLRKRKLEMIEINISRKSITVIGVLKQGER